MPRAPGAGASSSAAPASSAPSLSGSGIFKDAASDASLRQVFFDCRIVAFQAVIPDFGIVTGPFQVTALEYGGEHNGEVTFEATLESAGALGFQVL